MLPVQSVSSRSGAVDMTAQKIRSRRWASKTVAGGLIAALVSNVVSGAAFGADLVQHRATYSMFLAKSGGTAAIVGARGAMLYDFKDTCDGWGMDTKVYLRLRYAQGPEVENVRTMSTWEAKDGSGFRFRVEESGAGEKVQEIKGVAVAEQNSGIAEFTAPRAFTADLPAKTIFPSAHLRALIDTAQAGKTHLGRVLFDGASLDNPFLVSALIHPLEGESAAETEAHPKWRARMAYYPTRDKTETPSFELVVDFDETGIVYRVVQDFDDYVIEARIDKFERLPPPNC